MIDPTDMPDGDNVIKASKADLVSFMDRIGQLEDDKALIAESVKDLYAEYKAKGYDVKALRIAHSLSKKEKGVLEIVKLYGDHMGVFA